MARHAWPRTMLAGMAMAGLLVGGPTGAAPAGNERGNSGLPPGPGNPLAQLHRRLTALEARFGEPTVVWINHLGFLAGDATVVTSFNANTSGVGGGVSGLIIESTTVGDTNPQGGDKVVETGLQVPPGYVVTGVRVCYELSNARSFITQVRIAQLDDPPGSTLTVLNDGTNHTDVGPVCVDTTPAIDADPVDGALRLSLRVNFGNIADRIVLRAVGLHVAPPSP